jgi:uncharacterized protein YggE
MVKPRMVAAAFIAAAALAGPSAAGAPASALAPASTPAIPAGGGQGIPDQAIVVAGHGVVEAAPDRAIVTVGAQFTRPAAQEAQERTSAAMTQILQRVLALGIPRERIQTVELNLFPQRRPNSNEISGYQGVQRITVAVDDLSLVGRVLDAAVTAGANLLDGVTFTLRDPAAARVRAFAAAVQDARGSANALAAAAGLPTPRIVRIEETGAIAPSVRMDGMGAAPMISTPVLPGTLSITAQVRVVFVF